MKVNKNGSNLYYLTRHFQFSFWLWVCSLLISLVFAFASSFSWCSSPELLVFPDMSVKGPPCSHDSFLMLIFLLIFHSFFLISCCLVAAIHDYEVPNGCNEPAQCSFQNSSAFWKEQNTVGEYTWSLFVRFFCMYFSCVSSLFWPCWAPQPHSSWSLWREREFSWLMVVF